MATATATPKAPKNAPANGQPADNGKAKPPAGDTPAAPEKKQEKHPASLLDAKGNPLTTKANKIPTTMIRIGDITVKDRHREKLKNVDRLAASIAAIGLINPVAVRKENGAYQLVAGERRLKAAQLLGWTEVPASVVESDQDMEMYTFMTEIMENTEREAFSPSEAAKYAEKITAMLNGKKGVKGGKNQRMRDIVARMTGYSHETTRKAGAVAKAAEAGVPGAKEAKEEMDRTGKVDKAYKDAVVTNRNIEKNKKDEAGHVLTADQAKLFLVLDIYRGLNTDYRALTRSLTEIACHAGGMRAKAALKFHGERKNPKTGTTAAEYSHPQIDAAVDAVLATAPYSICLKCVEISKEYGVPAKGCPGCKGSHTMTKDQYNNAPAELKDRVRKMSEEYEAKLKKK